MVSFTHEQNSICRQKKLNGIGHEHTIIYRQLFTGHVVGSWPNEKEETFASNDNSICFSAFCLAFLHLGIIPPICITFRFPQINV